MPRRTRSARLTAPLEVRPRQDHGQLLPAVAGREVDLARRLPQHLRDLAQHHVALLVTVSLTRLKSSMSSSTRPTGWPKRRKRSTSSSRFSSKRRRLDSPVSSSVTDWRSTVSCSPTLAIETAAWPAR